MVALLSGATSGLAGAAADVLTEIVLKRMDAAAKLRCVLPEPRGFSHILCKAYWTWAY